MESVPLEDLENAFKALQKNNKGEKQNVIVVGIDPSSSVAALAVAMLKSLGAGDVTLIPEEHPALPITVEKFEPIKIELDQIAQHDESPKPREPFYRSLPKFKKRRKT